MSLHAHHPFSSIEAVDPRGRRALLRATPLTDQTAPLGSAERPLGRAISYSRAATAIASSLSRQSRRATILPSRTVSTV